MMSIRSLADFNRSSLGGDGDWLTPPPSPPRPQTPGRHDERGMGTFNWPPARTSTWPYTGTFSWPRTPLREYVLDPVRAFADRDAACWRRSAGGMSARLSVRPVSCSEVHHATYLSLAGASGPAGAAARTGERGVLMALPVRTPRSPGGNRTCRETQAKQETDEVIEGSEPGGGPKQPGPVLNSAT